MPLYRPRLILPFLRDERSATGRRSVILWAHPSYSGSLMLHRWSLIPVSFAVIVSCQSAASDIEEIVVSATREATDWFKTDASISSISAETLSNEQAVHANEIFDNVAGVWISRGNGQENLTAIRSQYSREPEVAARFSPRSITSRFGPQGFVMSTNYSKASSNWPQA